MEPHLAQKIAQMTIVIVREASRWGQIRSSRVQQILLQHLHHARQIQDRPFARLHMSTPQGRREDPTLMLAYMIQISVEEQSWPRFMTPCERCGQPTGSWCEACDNPNVAICTECENDNYICQECDITMCGWRLRYRNTVSDINAQFWLALCIETRIQ